MWRHVTMVALFLDDNKTTTKNQTNDKKVIGFYWQNNVHHAILFISLPWLHPWDMKLPNFKRWFYEVGEHNTNVVFFFF